MPYTFHQTYTCVVVFLDLVEFSRLTNDLQVAVKRHFYALLDAALADTDPAERIQKDTGDGAVIAFFGSPEEPLHFLVKIATLAPDYPDLHFRTGAHLGPCTVVPSLDGRPDLIGDGINAAQRVMSFAGSAEILVSHAFHDTAAWLDATLSDRFVRLPSRADKHGREHELYRFVPVPAGDTLSAPRADETKSERKGRSLRVAGAGLLLVVTTVGGALWWWRTPPQAERSAALPSPRTQPVATAAAPSRASRAPASAPMPPRPAQDVAASRPPPSPASAVSRPPVRVATLPRPQRSEPAQIKPAPKPPAVHSTVPTASPEAPVAETAFNCADLATQVSLGVEPLSDAQRRYFSKHCK